MTRAEVDRIRGLLEAQGLTDPSLQRELLDHVCCDVEYYIA